MFVLKYKFSKRGKFNTFTLKDNAYVMWPAGILQDKTLQRTSRFFKSSIICSGCCIWRGKGRNNSQKLCGPPEREDKMSCASTFLVNLLHGQNTYPSNTNLKQQRCLFFKYYVLSI